MAWPFNDITRKVWRWGEVGGWGFGIVRGQGLVTFGLLSEGGHANRCKRNLRSRALGTNYYYGCYLFHFRSCDALLWKMFWLKNTAFVAKQCICVLLTLSSFILSCYAEVCTTDTKDRCICTTSNYQIDLNPIVKGQTKPAWVYDLRSEQDCILSKGSRGCGSCLKF